MDNEEHTPVFSDTPTQRWRKYIKSVLVKTAQENPQITVMNSVLTDGANFEQFFFTLGNTSSVFLQGMYF
jgi:hypothetical protein